jgi:hypothetical protein
LVFKKINYLDELITKPTHEILSAGVINNPALCKKYWLYGEHEKILEQMA